MSHGAAACSRPRVDRRRRTGRPPRAVAGRDDVDVAVEDQAGAPSAGRGADEAPGLCARRLGTRGTPGRAARAARSSARGRPRAPAWANHPARRCWASPSAADPVMLGTRTSRTRSPTSASSSRASRTRRSRRSAAETLAVTAARSRCTRDSGGCDPRRDTPIHRVEGVSLTPPDRSRGRHLHPRESRCHCSRGPAARRTHDLPRLVGWLEDSVPNLLVVLATLAVFALALLLPFPGHPDPEDRP